MRFSVRVMSKELEKEVEDGLETTDSRKVAMTIGWLDMICLTWPGRYTCAWLLDGIMHSPSTSAPAYT
jgi:hypothetical protein